MDGFRHENKYFISRAGYQFLRGRLAAMLETDSHAVQSDGRYKILAQCKNTIAAFSQAVWEGGSLDRRLDDGSVNIDSLDAQEYSTERRMKDILDVMR